MREADRAIRRWASAAARQSPGEGGCVLRLYTLQAPQALRLADRRGYLTGDSRFVDPDFLTAYAWMRQQMAKRLVVYTGELPIWAWMARPDLRRVRDSDHVRLVLLAIDVPPERVLLSDFDAWHFVLNGVAADLSEEESPSPPTSTGGMEQTWDVIFDLQACAALAGEHQVLQACVDRVHVAEIAARREFTVRAWR